MADRTCSVDYCDRTSVARGWCNKHWSRWKKHGDPLHGDDRPTVCIESGCGGKIVGRGWCELHYRRWNRHGGPHTVSRIVGNDVARFEIYLRPGPTTSGMGACWAWSAGHDRDGYANFRGPRGEQTAHRWAYVHHVGPIPDGLELDHLCRNRGCVNPWHLDPVPHDVNVLRAAEVRYGRDRADAGADCCASVQPGGSA